MEHIKGLNEAQKKAVLATTGPVLIVAGAGAGKTKTLTARIVHLIHEGVAPHHILAITFTNKAAAEMRERVHKALEKERQGSMPWLGTFHSFSAMVLRQYAEHVGRTKHFAILDEDDSVKLVKEAIEACSLDPKQYDAKRFKHIISHEKGNFVTMEGYRERANSHLEDVIARVWEKYESYLSREGAFDFDDLLLQTVLLLRKNSSVREALTERFQYVHIDEYQDTNEVQYEMTKLLARPRNNICVVGDTDQNIYSWRGAKLANMLNFEKDFPGTQIFFLEQNYRSTKTILAAANAVIQKNTMRVPKTLFTENGDGEQISVYESYDEQDEAAFIAKEAYKLTETGIAPGDIAVLYRANFQSRVLEEAFLEVGIQYQVLGVKFYDRKEVRDVLSYLRAAWNRDTLADIRRALSFPSRGIGKVTLVKLFSGKKDELPASMQQKIHSFYGCLDKIKEYGETNTASDTIRFAVKESGIEDALKKGDATDLERLENIQELATLAKRYDHLPPGEGISKMLDDASLASDQDNLDEKIPGVRLMTVHAAKGLEFPYVFVAGLEQDLFPHSRGDGANVENREEERRLFYVAVTRAGKKLYLSYATIRTLFGMREVRLPSEFLYDLPDELVTREVGHTPRIKTVYLD